MLIALYRYSNIPSRYVTGVVEIPIEQAMNWTGVEKPDVAAKVFSSGGIPSTAIVSGGKISAIQMEHTWAEAYVDYEDYRGVGDAAGEKAWVPLDASFKSYEYKKPVDLKGILGLDPESFMTTDTAVLQQKMAEATATLENYIDTNMPNETLGDVIGAKSIQKEELGLLPASLPSAFKVISTAGEQQDLVDTQRYHLTLATTGLSFKEPLPELAGKRITVYYSPATQADADLLTAYGGLYNVPAYLMTVKPVVLVDGVAKSSGSSLTLGDTQALDITIGSGARQERLTKIVDAGAYYSIGLDLGSVSPQLIKDRKTRMQENMTTVRNDGEADADEITGELLNLTSLLYFGQVDSMSGIMAGVSGVAVYKEASVAVPSYRVATDYVFGTPASVSFGGADIDVLANQYIAQAKDGDQGKTKSWTVASGYLSSGGEHTIFEEMYRAKAVSTVKILSVANEQGIPIHQITSEKVDTELASIEASPEVKAAIRASVAQGHVITIPERLVTHMDWTGQGWIDMDPDTGDAGYLIQGGLAGGSITEKSSQAMDVLGMISDYVGAGVVRKEFVNTGGNLDSRYYSSFSSGFVDTAVGQALEVINLVVLPLAAAVFQYLEDMQNPNLSDLQKLQRAGAVFVVMAVVALAASLMNLI